MRPAGFENSQNIISATYQKDPTDPQWKDDAGIKNVDAFLTKYFPEGNREDLNIMTGHNVAQTMVHVLKECGDDLTRANIMKQAFSSSCDRHAGEQPRRCVTPIVGPIVRCPDRGAVKYEMVCVVKYEPVSTCNSLLTGKITTNKCVRNGRLPLEYCEAHGIPLKAFGNWRAKFKAGL
jgi:hypothetical protein